MIANEAIPVGKAFTFAAPIIEDRW